MILMPSNNSSAEVHYLAGRFPNRIGWLIGPSARSKSKLRPWIHYALDNDAFSAWLKETEWSESEWIAMLNWAKLNAQKPKWAIVPDVVANKQKTLENWNRYQHYLKQYNWPMAFAVQDGMTPDDVPINADVVFVGGSTEWKWKTVSTWTRNFKRVHVGRVNSVSKLWHCQDLGVESVDGTGWFRDPSDPSKFPAVLDWLSGLRYDENQMNLEIE
jgi:hypothetical protein